MAKKKKVVNQRERGTRFERKLRTRLRKIGFKEAMSTREGSNYLDGKKIDIMNIPFILQAKYGKQTALKYPALLKLMKEKTSKTEYKDLPMTVFHTDDGRRKHTKLVIMPEEDFFNILTDVAWLLRQQNNRVSETFYPSKFLQWFHRFLSK